MHDRLHFLWQDERGAVTVDWVVLSAAVIAVTLGIMSSIGGQINNTSDQLGVKLQTAVSNASTPTTDTGQN